MKKMKLFLLLGALTGICAISQTARSQSETCTADAGGVKGHCSAVVSGGVIVGFACDPNSTGSIPCNH